MAQLTTQGSETVLVNDRSGGIRTIVMNRPAALNALDRELVDALNGAIADAAQNPDVRVVVLTGQGRAFTAGGDLSYLLSLKNIADARQFVLDAGAITAALCDLAKPVICMVNGVAAGAGFNIALAGDIVFAAASARFAQSFARVGLVPDCGGQFLLPRIVGPYKAKELMFTGDLLDAAAAERLGVVNRVLPDDQLEAATYAFAERLAKAAPLPLAMIKKSINAMGNFDLASMLEVETTQQLVCLQTDDFKNGVEAFKAKREPVFTGK